MRRWNSEKGNTGWGLFPATCILAYTRIHGIVVFWGDFVFAVIILMVPRHYDNEISFVYIEVAIIANCILKLV